MIYANPTIVEAVRNGDKSMVAELMNGMSIDDLIPFPLLRSLEISEEGKAAVLAVFAEGGIDVHCPMGQLSPEGQMIVFAIADTIVVSRRAEYA